MSEWSGSRRIGRGSGYIVGRYRCPAGDELWRSENWIGVAPHIVFPGPAVRISQAGHEPVVATPNEVVLYRAGTSYRRQLVSPEGDDSVFIELQPPLADQVGSFESTWIPVAGPLSVLHRVLARLDAVDPLLLDECVMAAIAAVGAAGRLARRRPLPADGRDAVEAVKATVARRLTDRLTLAELAAEVHYSPFHLARLFRAHTGKTVHAYRTQLRVSRAVELALGGRTSLAAVSADVGFASHGHLTRNVRQVLGIRPVELRRAQASCLAQLLAAASSN